MMIAATISRLLPLLKGSPSSAIVVVLDALRHAPVTPPVTVAVTLPDPDLLTLVAALLLWVALLLMRVMAARSAREYERRLRRQEERVELLLLWLWRHRGDGHHGGEER